MNIFEAFLDKKNYIIIRHFAKTSFLINNNPLYSELISQYDDVFVYKAYCEIDISNEYIIKDEYNNECKLNIRYFVKDNSFDELFYYENNDLGATYSPESTTFKVWAPIASKVILHYEINNDIYEINMHKTDKGVFEVCVHSNLENALYYYKISNNGKEEIAQDPYAFSSNANSKKSAVINFDKINNTNNSRNLSEFNNITDAIIYELSVRDFSMDGSLGEDVKGTFNAFLKHGIKSKNGHSIGIDYLKELGVTHIQLMPIFDFVTVNEENIFERYNWGYDPFCYNTIEGSFSSNPNNPYARINEVKAMIEELHKEGLRVVVDVVFNHTYAFIDSLFNRLVPNYYYLMDENGNLSNGSFCGNDIDTTRKMVHKYFCDMCVRYVKMYNIDGFRFDLMGILSKDLVMDIYNKCKEIKPDFIMYGEGWNMPSMLNESLRASLNNANQLPNIAFFNDYFRDTVSGKTFNNFSCVNGFLTGNTSLFYDFVRSMRGSIEHNCYFENPTSSINYVECHDNFTLFDKLKITNSANTDTERNNIQLSCIAAILFSQGIPFLHSGMEFNRSKKGNENSYNAGDKINMIRWENVDIYEKNIKAVKDFITIRKKFNCFKINNRKKILNSIDGKIENNVLSLTHAYDDNIVVLVFNPTNKKQSFSLNGDYQLYANQFGYVKNDEKVYNRINVKPYGFMMFIK